MRVTFATAIELSAIRVFGPNCLIYPAWLARRLDSRALGFYIHGIGLLTLRAVNALRAIRAIRPLKYLGKLCLRIHLGN